MLGNRRASLPSWANAHARLSTFRGGLGRWPVFSLGITQASVLRKLANLPAYELRAVRMKAKVKGCVRRFQWSGSLFYACIALTYEVVTSFQGSHCELRLILNPEDAPDSHLLAHPIVTDTIQPARSQVAET